MLSNPEKSLGQATAKDFNGKRLFVQSAGCRFSMLSIQVHPTKEAAIKEFAAENKAEILLYATNREILKMTITNLKLWWPC